MRKLIFVKGPPGSGKSTFIQSMHWEPYALNMDQLRLQRRGPELDSMGRLQISQDDNDTIYREWLGLVQRRMERGEFLVLDATFVERPDAILKFIEKFHYQAACVDFSTVPLETIVEQNESRPQYKYVAPHIIERKWNKFAHQSPWEGVFNIPWSPTKDHVQTLENWVRVPMQKFDGRYTKIVHIGDLQGCLTVLLGPGGALEHGFDDDTLYIFVGDLLDRGIENGKVLRWFVDHALPRTNVVLVWGNHEDHLRRWANNEEAVSDEFANRTLPQLLQEGLTPQDAAAVCAKAVEMMQYEFAGQQVLVTHAGLPTVPLHPELISLHQYSKGTGRWSDPIDEQFERNAPPNWVQVHGHRNHGWQDIQARPRSFNLEDQVEFGGRLRWATLSAQGWTVGSKRNNVYDLTGASKIERQRIQWPSKGTALSADTAAALRAHSGVRERAMIKEPHIVSFNFTKDVFFNASWDDVVVKARGFFVNKTTNEIVSRGYDKFFNIGERTETKIEHLCASMTFPVVGYVKENGFLGNIGYDAATGDLFVATKSSSSGDFSQWFRAILDSQLTQAQQEGLARWLRDNEACMTFEVIDPVRDPHMIAYAKPQLFLLDVFHRSEHAERLPYEELKGVGHKFGLACKQRGVVLHTPEALQKWHEKVAKDLAWRYHGQDIEGFVLEDAVGNMTKIKMAHYAFWKKMRGQKERMQREWDKECATGIKRNAWLDANPRNQAPRFDEQHARTEFAAQWGQRGQKIHPVAAEFLQWCALLPKQEWDASIIMLRERFVAAHPQQRWDVPYSQDPHEGEIVPAAKPPKP